MVQIIPVIHHLNSSLTMEQIDIARKCGANGAFLISHHGDDDAILSAAAAAKAVASDFPIGVNLLSKPYQEAFRLAHQCGADMFWADYMGVSSRGTEEDCRRVAAQTAECGMKIFASVAFKHQPDESDPAGAAAAAADLRMIPTTSGPATGLSADIAKVRLMSRAAGGMLALASGVTPDNVRDYAPFVSHILVATGIAEDEYRIDPGLLYALMGNARMLQK